MTEIFQQAAQNVAAKMMDPAQDVGKDMRRHLPALCPRQAMRGIFQNALAAIPHETWEENSETGEALSRNAARAPLFSASGLSVPDYLSDVSGKGFFIGTFDRRDFDFSNPVMNFERKYFTHNEMAYVLGAISQRPAVYMGISQMLGTLALYGGHALHAANQEPVAQNDAGFASQGNVRLHFSDIRNLSAQQDGRFLLTASILLHHHAENHAADAPLQPETVARALKWLLKTGGFQGLTDTCPADGYLCALAAMPLEKNKPGAPPVALAFIQNAEAQMQKPHWKAIGDQVAGQFTIELAQLYNIRRRFFHPVLQKAGDENADKKIPAPSPKRGMAWILSTRPVAFLLGRAGL